MGSRWLHISSKKGMCRMVPASQLTRQRGAHPITLAERERILFFDAAATFLLVDRYGPGFIGELYGIVRDKDDSTKTSLKLKSGPALQFFLYAGLQADAREIGEQISLEDCETFIRPWTMLPIFHVLVKALSGTMYAPADPEGKASAPPAAAVKRAKVKRGSTSTKHSATRSGS